MLKSKNVDMLHGPIAKGLVVLALPILLMNVINSLYSTIDMAVLGKFASDTSVGAVGACATIISVFINFFTGISVGVNVIVARFIGQGNREKTEKSVGTSLFFSLAGGILIAIIGIVFSEQLLRMTDCPQTLLKDAVLYFRLYFLGVPVFFLYTFSAAIQRSVGDSKRPMYFLILCGFIKIILNFIFVYFFKAGVIGVAVSTIISNSIAALLSINAVKQYTEYFAFSLKSIRYSSFAFKEILKTGLPAGLQKAFSSFANVVIATAINGFGEYATTGVSIANQFDNILYQIVTAIPHAAIPFIAQNVGAKNLPRAKKVIIYTALLTVGIGATFGAFSAVFSAQLSSLISTTPEVIKYSCQKMVIVSSTYFIAGINELMGGALRGLGRNNVPTVSTLLFMCAIRFPWVYFVFPLYPNLTFLYLIWPIGWILSISTQLCFYFPTMRKLERNLLEQKT